MSVLANKIFNEIFDKEMLNKMEEKGVIAQVLGFKITTVINIDLCLEENKPKVSHKSIDDEYSSYDIGHAFGSHNAHRGK